MIYNLEIKPCGKAPKGGDDYFFRKLYGISVKSRKFDFTDGINFLIGPNGCGKTTLLNILAAKMSIERSSQCNQMPPENLAYAGWMSKTKEDKKYEEYLDEQYVCDTGYILDSSVTYKNVLTYYINRSCFNPMKAISNALISGKTYSNVYKNGISGFAEKFTIRSNGERSIYNLLTFIDNNSDKVTFDDDYFKSFVNFRTENIFRLMSQWQKDYHDDNAKPTLLIDEIDEGMDLLNKAIFFQDILPILAEKYQIIIVSHSSLVMNYFNNDNANFISFYSEKEMNLIKKIYNL